MTLQEIGSEKPGKGASAAGNECVALVTARGGSKRIPGKNIRNLGGKPLICWSIEAALSSRTITRVLISTDSPEIAEIAARAGAEVPFLRPQELSGDQSSHYDVIAHAMNWLEQTDARVPETICLLQPTSPLRTADDIDRLVTMVRDQNADSGFTVSPVANHPSYMYRLEATGRAAAYLPPRPGYLRSQDVEPLYYVNGAVYVLRPATFRKRDTVLSPDPIAHVMPRLRSIDIDEEMDFLIAEALIAATERGWQET